MWGFSYVVQEGLYLAEDGFRHLDGTRPALGLTQLAQGGQVIHGVGEWLIVPVHQAQALQREHGRLVYACFPITGPDLLRSFREVVQSNLFPKTFLGLGQYGAGGRN